MTDKRIDSPLADDDGDAIKRITPERFAELDKSTVTLLDLREPDEVLVHGLDGAINIPFNQIGTRLSQVPNDKPVVVFCRVGDWSEQVTEILADRGYDAINLDGGFQAYREYLASLPQQRENDVDDGDARPEKQAKGSAATLSIPAAAQQISLRGPEHESKSTGAADSAALHGSNGDTDGAQPHAVFVDAKGLKCPGPIVKVADTLRPLPIGTRLTAEATEDAFLSDIAVWCERVGNRLVSLERDENGVIHVVIDKTAHMPAPGAPAAACPSSPAGRAVSAETPAAAMGRKVTIFFTFWGLNILRKPKRVRVRKTLIERMFGMMMPRGTRKLGLSRMNMGGIGAKMIRWIMKSKNVESLESLMKQATDHGVRLVACQMSMDIMGIHQEELIDGVELGGVSTFLGSGETSDMSLFV